MGVIIFFRNINLIYLAYGRKSLLISFIIRKGSLRPGKRRIHRGLELLQLFHSAIC